MRFSRSLILALLVAAPGAHSQIAVRADTLYTMAGLPIVDGIVMIHEGKVDHVGSYGSATIPSGYRLMEAVVVTPGFVDGRSTVGLSGMLNQEQDQDVLDDGSAIQPSLRAIDAYNARDEL
ncbi:MAG: amidohydrolase, partial [Rubricoccaceae bacterium]|nr:amidohydrolase [Rubricoccaceae bacterium]